MHLNTSHHILNISSCRQLVDLLHCKTFTTGCKMLLFESYSICEMLGVCCMLIIQLCFNGLYFLGWLFCGQGGCYNVWSEGKVMLYVVRQIFLYVYIYLCILRVSEIWYHCNFTILNTKKIKNNRRPQSGIAQRQQRGTNSLLRQRHTHIHTYR